MSPTKPSSIARSRKTDADVPPLLVELCDSCLKRDHNLRCQSAEQVADNLQTWLDAQRPPARRPLLVGISALVLVLVLAGIGYGVARLTGVVGGVEQDVKTVEADVKQLEQTVEQKSQESLDEIRKLYEKPEVLVAVLQSHIRERAEEQIAELRKDSANWRKIDKIEKQRDAALERVEDLVETIRTGLTGDPDPIFAEAARILAEQGVDEALKYLDEKHPDIKERIERLERRRDEAEQDLRDALESLMLKADLYETNLAWDEALELYETIVEKAPEWSRARRELGDLLRELAEFDQAEPHLKAGFDLADDDQQRASAANSLGLLYCDQARHEEAEPLLQRYRELSEKLYGRDDPETATALNNLAQLLQATQRLAEAEPLLRRALAIDEQSYGAEHADVAIDLNNLGALLRLANRLAEAEPLMRRALAIDEQSYGAKHPEVAIDLNNLAQLLQATNRLAEAEPLMRRALAIDEQSYGAEHPRVAAQPQQPGAVAPRPRTVWRRPSR